jgi:putative CRISPR-associated protein (TIGR02620 family)
MEYLSLDATCAALTLSRTQVRRLLAAGILVGTRHGGNRRGVWLIEAASVEAEQRRRKTMARRVIVSRHASTIEWLREMGVEGDVVTEATPDAVRGAIVYGNLPLHLAALADEVWAVGFMTPPPRGVELDRATMEECGVHVAGYKVMELE